MDKQWTQLPDLDSMSDLDFLQMPQDAGLPYDGTDLGFDFSAINNVEPQANTDKSNVERCASQHGTPYQILTPDAGSFGIYAPDSRILSRAHLKSRKSTKLFHYWPPGWTG